MKRFALLLLIPALLFLLLGRDALIPGRFTGAWYEAGTGEEYWFEEGLVRKDACFRGAYSFTRSSITLFVSGAEEMETVQTLWWRSGKDGEVLCTEAGDIRFRRVP